MSLINSVMRQTIPESPIEVELKFKDKLERLVRLEI